MHQFTKIAKIVAQTWRYWDICSTCKLKKKQQRSTRIAIRETGTWGLPETPQTITALSELMVGGGV